MALKLHNTLTGETEDFKPLELGKVGMYNCGPTVYDYAHIGNLRSFLLADLLRRALEMLGFEVRQVMNITDVGIGGNNDEGEDKIIKGLKREGKPVTMENMKELGKFYTERFLEDIKKFNILTPSVMPKASEHIPEDIELIKKLEEKGFTYQTKDGIYFDTSRDKHYGRLGFVGEDTQSRIEMNPDKKSPRDFALWKFNANLGYPSPWGQGFPGWHIECSAMARKYLGDTFDIHTGGMDLAPIHHNNEIAQSETACDCEFVHYWIHNEFVNVSGEKMAKSEGNYLTLNVLIEKGFSPLAYRYFLLLSHYRTQTNFTWEALQSAQNAYRKLKEYVASLQKQEAGSINQEYESAFKKALENDLNTPEALAVVWKVVKDDSLPPADKRATLLEFDKVLGLDLEHNEYEMKEIPREVLDMVEEREAARLAKDWARADELRGKISDTGFQVDDTDSGPQISKL